MDEIQSQKVLNTLKASLQDIQFPFLLEVFCHPEKSSETPAKASLFFFFQGLKKEKEEKNKENLVILLSFSSYAWLGNIYPIPFRIEHMIIISRKPSCPDKLDEHVPLNRVNLILRTD